MQCGQEHPNSVSEQWPTEAVLPVRHCGRPKCRLVQTTPGSVTAGSGRDTASRQPGSCGWRRGRPVCEDGTVASGLVLAGAGCDTGQSRRVLGRIEPGAARCGLVQPGTRVYAGISGLYRGGGCSHRGNRLCAGDTLNGAPMNPVGCAEYRARAGHIYKESVEPDAAGLRTPGAW